VRYFLGKNGQKAKRKKKAGTCGRKKLLTAPTLLEMAGYADHPRTGHKGVFSVLIIIAIGTAPGLS